MILFVYGTLKRNHHANHLLTGNGGKFLGQARTEPKYHLYRVGWYPGMYVDESIEGGVLGELWKVPEEAFVDLDSYEGVPHLFRREEITLDDGIKVLAYLYNGEIIAKKRIVEGVWKSS